MSTEVSVIRDKHGKPGDVSVVLASNDRGRIEPFVFENRGDAERAADRIAQMPGHINIVLLYHGVELCDTHAAQRFAFGLAREGFGDEPSGEEPLSDAERYLRNEKVYRVEYNKAWGQMTRIMYIEATGMAEIRNSGGDQDPRRILSIRRATIADAREMESLEEIRP